MTRKLNSHPVFARLVTSLVLIAFAAGCTTMRPLAGTDTAALAGQIVVGDKVRLIRTDFSAIEFEVEDLADDGIGGDGIFVPWTDIQQVEVRRIDKLRTGTVIVLSAVALAAAVFSSGSGFGPVTLGAPAP